MNGGLTDMSWVASPSVAAGPPATGVGVMLPAPPGGVPVRPAREVDAEHRQAEERRLEDGLLVDAADVLGARDVRPLRGGERLADRDGVPAAPARSSSAKSRYSRSLYSRKSVSPYW